MRPFIGFTFGGATTFVDPEVAIETQNVVFGASGGWLGEIFGLEADFGRSPGFFQRDDSPEDEKLVSSAVTTLTGNVVIALAEAVGWLRAAPLFLGRRRLDARGHARQVCSLSISTARFRR